jgi:aspartate/methionine/tyrosine aminotransferase
VVRDGGIGQSGPVNTLITPVAASLRQSDIRLIGQAIHSRGLSPIRLDIGEPDLPTSPHVLEEATLAAGRPTSYTPAAGTPAFRAAAADYLRVRHALEVSPDDIVIGNGATGALMSCFQLLTRAGDEWLVPVPAFPCYRTQIALAGGVAVGYPLAAEHDWIPSLADLEDRITSRTRGIVINSPGNPTGAVLPAETLSAIAGLAERRGLAILSDEVYADMAFDAPAVSALAADRARTFSVFSLSKTFSMTGWRVGFTVAPPGAGTQLAAVNSQNMASANSVAQAVAIAALTGPWADVDSRRETFARRRDAVHAWLGEQGIPHTLTGGAFYQPLPLPVGTDSFEAAMSLLDDGVALVPGRAFVESAQPFLRMSLTADIPTLLDGLAIVEQRFWK